MKRTLVAVVQVVLDICGSWLCTFDFGAAAAAIAIRPKVGDPPEVSNMRLVGYSDPAGPQLLPADHKQGNRYGIAYVGHHGGAGRSEAVQSADACGGFNGTSIVDTDPANPKYLKHLPEPLAARGRRRADDEVRRRQSRRTRSQQILSAAHLRREGVTRSGRSPIRPIR
jgi:hypothetical protein